MARHCYAVYLNQGNPGRPGGVSGWPGHVGRVPKSEMQQLPHREDRYVGRSWRQCVQATLGPRVLGSLWERLRVIVCP